MVSIGCGSMNLGNLKGNLILHVETKETSYFITIKLKNNFLNEQATLILGKKKLIWLPFRFLVIFFREAIK